MPFTILLFSPEARALGASSVTVPANPGATCTDLRDHLAANHPALRPLLPAARFAVNSQFVPLTHTPRETDEIALIGLVSGG